MNEDPPVVRKQAQHQGKFLSLQASYLLSQHARRVPNHEDGREQNTQFPRRHEDKDAVTGRTDSFAYPGHALDFSTSGVPNNAGALESVPLEPVKGMFTHRCSAGRSSTSLGSLA